MYGAVVAASLTRFPYLWAMFLGDPGDPEKSLTINLYFTIISMRVGHPTKKLHVDMNFVGIIHAKNFQSRRSWVLDVNFLKKPGQKLPPVRDKLPWDHQLFWCFEMCSPFFGPRFVVFFILFDMSSPNPSWAPASCSLPKVHPPKTNMEPENGGPLEKEIPIGNHHSPGSMLNFRSVGVIW